MSPCLTHIYAAVASVSSPPSLGEDGLYDIVEVAPYVFPWSLLWSGIASLVILTVIALSVRWFMSRTGPRAHPESPHAKALRRLREVAASLDTTEPNRTSLALSELLKDYLSERFRDNLRYETTPEFLRRISRQSIKLPVAAQQDLSLFLKSADQIKFGNVPASSSDISALHHLAARIVNLCQTVGDDSNRRQTELDLQGRQSLKIE
jgi:hypothetical protein